MKIFLTKHYDQRTIKMITRLARLVLEHNYFGFKGEMFLQTAGTAMGTGMAPSYAIIFMNNLETNLLKALPTKPRIRKRYIDDIFIITHGDPQTLTEWLNQ